MPAGHRSHRRRLRLARLFSPGNNGAAVARIGSQRIGKRKLKTTGYNFGDETGVLNSLAYCSKAGRRVRVASDKVFVGPQSAGVAVATCPGRSKVVAGGFASPGFSAAAAPRVITMTSKRVGPDQWRVEGFNLGNDNGNNTSDPHPGTLIAYAYCLDDAAEAHRPPQAGRGRRPRPGQVVQGPLSAPHQGAVGRVRRQHLPLGQRDRLPARSFPSAPPTGMPGSSGR